MKIKWDEVGKRLYETGVDHGVLFPMGEDNAYGKGVLRRRTQRRLGRQHQVPEPDECRGLRRHYRGLYLS